MLLLVIFIFLLIIILTTRFKLVIEINNEKNEIALKVYILFLFCIMKINLNKLRNSTKNEKLKKRLTKFTKSKKEIFRYIYKYINRFNIKLEKLKLNINLSTSDPALTAYSVAIISTIITFILKYFKINIDLKNCSYKINPIYIEKPLLKINIFCIISINMVHIIYIITRNFKKWRCDFNGRTTSNRRAYGNCNE